MAFRKNVHGSVYVLLACMLLFCGSFFKCAYAAESVGLPPALPGASSPTTLPGTEITPEQMQKMFPAPLSKDAPSLDFVPNAAPLIPILPPRLSGEPESPSQSTGLPALPALPPPAVMPQTLPQTLPHVTPSQQSPAQIAPQTQLPLAMPQGGSSPSTQGTQSIQNTQGGQGIPALPTPLFDTPHTPEQQKSEQKGIPAYPTIEVMVGQMIMAGFAGTELDTSMPNNVEGTSIIQLARQGKVGGVFLQPISLVKGEANKDLALSQGNMTSATQTRQLTSTLQRAASESATGIPLFVAVVQEGGLEQSLRPELGFEGLASAAHLGRGRVEETEIAARRNGLEMAGVGINFAFGPAGDVNINPLSEDIGKRFRSFGADPSLVAQHVAAVGRGFAAARVIPCMRNYPGTGSFVRGFTTSPMQSNTSNLPNILDSLPDVGRTWQNAEMVPYSHTLRQGWAGAVQPALAYVRSIDPLHPAPLSRTLIASILRGQLAFDGVVVTQDLRAMQPFYTIEESAVQAVLAGADILLVTEPFTQPQQGAASPLSLFQENMLEGGGADMKALLQQELFKHLPGNMSNLLGGQVQTKEVTGQATMAAKVYAALLSSVRNGRISVERLRHSWRRIVRMKQAFLYTTEPPVIK